MFWLWKEEIYKHREQQRYYKIFFHLLCSLTECVPYHISNCRNRF